LGAAALDVLQPHLLTGLSGAHDFHDAGRRIVPNDHDSILLADPPPRTLNAGRDI
jgi:hypothetical protein